MLKSTLFLWFSLVFFFTSFGQVTIRGRVVDVKTKSPVKNALVYYDQSRISTRTNNEGYFLLHAEHPISKLVCVSNGYQKTVLDSVILKSMKLIIEVKPAEPENRLSTADRVNNWNKYKRLFLSFFFRETDSHQHPMLNGEPDIDLIYDSKSDIFEARMYSPLFATVGLFKHDVRLDLTYFKIDLKTEAIESDQTLLFMENTTSKYFGSSSAVNRAYFLSKKNFLRLLVADSLAAYGYHMYQYTQEKQSKPLEEKIDSIKLAKLKKGRVYYGNETHLIANLDRYSSYRKQKASADFLAKDTVEINPNDLFHQVDSSSYELNFKDSLFVILKSNLIADNLLGLNDSYRDHTVLKEFVIYLQADQPELISRQGIPLKYSLKYIDKSEYDVFRKLPIEFDAKLYPYDYLENQEKARLAETKRFGRRVSHF